MKNKIIVCIIQLLLVVVYIYEVKAIPAYPYPIKMAQSDGTSLTVLLHGDEFFAYNTSVDGYLITRNTRGIFEYADVSAEGKIIPLGVKVYNVEERSSRENQFIKSISKSATLQKLTQSVQDNTRVNLQTRSSQTARSATGTKRILCILIGFPDRPFVKTQSEFNNFMNQSGYNVGTAIGSVKDYYLENSYNQLNLNITVVGPYTADHNMVYYGENINDTDGNRIRDIRPQDLIKEALLKANPDVNYADFDNDNNGTVDGVHVIYAGYAEAAGGGAETIWPHQWTVSGVSYDGKRISDYSCSAELRGNWGSQIDGIGTACHEIGHVLGAPDFYDTQRDNVNWAGTGNWDLMAGGNWNIGGDRPAHHNPYTKSQIFGWASINNLPPDNTLITLEPAV